MGAVVNSPPAGINRDDNVAAHTDINPVSGRWEELVEDEGRWMIILRHSTGRARPLSYLGDEFTARRVARWMREQGHRVEVVDRAA